MLNGLDLFTGIGGMSIALEEWVKPISYCEIDPYCQGVLLSRMADESLRNAPIWDDIKTLDGTIFNGAIDIIYGGFPCQDISIAGNGKGLDGERSGLFFEIMRMAKEIKPQFLFLENVPAITSRGGVTVIKEIAEMGYDCRWCVIPASSMGSPQKRERWFLLANSSSLRRDKRPSEELQSARQASQYAEPCNISDKNINYWEDIKSPVLGMANGVPNRVDRVRALGNAVVPQQAKKAFKILMGL